MATSKIRYCAPGEYIYDGMTLPKAIQPDILERVKHINLDNDVLIASYPKTGNIYHSPWQPALYQLQVIYTIVMATSTGNIYHSHGNQLYINHR